MFDGTGSLPFLYREGFWKVVFMAEAEWARWLVARFIVSRYLVLAGRP
jgi:hypothetical protein